MNGIKHLEHPEEAAFSPYDAEFDASMAVLEAIRDAANGVHRPGLTISTKWDGSPAIVFGHDPADGRFFVASKSALNKTPKICYSADDVGRLHSRSPGLADKLVYALDRLGAIAPEKGAYQADVLFIGGVEYECDTDLCKFRPNVVEYRAEADSELGQRLLAASLGIVVHTVLEGDVLDQMEPRAAEADDCLRFSPSKETYVAWPWCCVGHMSQFDDERFSRLASGADAARRAAVRERYVLEERRPALKRYVNACVREDTCPTLVGFLDFSAHDPGTFKVVLSTERDAIGAAIDAHERVRAAKEVLLDCMICDSGLESYVAGVQVQNEGFVATVMGKTVKLVDRRTFSRANFALNDRPKSATG